MSQHTTIAIIWWSFAGLSALLVLRKRLGKNVTIKLFEMRNNFCHIPALHEGILGSPSRVAAMQLSYAKRYPHEYIKTHISKIENNKLTTEQGDERTFDYAVIATGSRTNFFNNPQREKHAYAVRYADDIPVINAKLRDPNTKTITVIWGGYTGIEIASTIALRKRPDQKLLVLHSRERLFERLSNYISKTSIERLHRHGVEVRLNSRVADIHGDTVTLDSGEKIPSDMTIVSRGIKVNDESFAPHLTFTNAYSATSHDHIYMCGDVASHGLVATAHNAMFEGRRIGHLIADRLQKRENKTYPPLQNWDKLAIALGPYDGILTNGTKGLYIPRFVGFAKRIIERRVLFEYAYRVMLWI
jgi:NADH dehydrogenase FAD-containing subunit